MMGTMFKWVVLVAVVVLGILFRKEITRGGCKIYRKTRDVLRSQKQKLKKAYVAYKS